MQEKNYLSVTLFVLIIFILLLGGNYLIKNKDRTLVTQSKDIRIDNTKDYIYFTDSKTISEDLDLVYSTIHINISSDEAKIKEEELNQEMDKALASVKKYSKDELEKIEHLDQIGEEGIYFADYLKYDVLESDKYITLETIKGHYSLENDNDNNLLEFYTFSKTDGHIMNEEEIKSVGKISDKDILNTKSKYLEDKENTEIKSYELYIDKYGNTMINLLVNSGNITYNDTVIIN